MTDEHRFQRYVVDFRSLPDLGDRVLRVLTSLPGEVQDDFLTDPCFHVSLDNYQSGKGGSVFMAIPLTKDGSRSVVLRPRLAKCSEPFALYVIAHEFAHAFLRNGPWGEITDVEDAADALAGSWGYPKVAPRVTDWVWFRG